jgi:chromatin remodeling complex protein RSC6
MAKKTATATTTNTTSTTSTNNVKSAPVEVAPTTPETDNTTVDVSTVEVATADVQVKERLEQLSAKLVTIATMVRELQNEIKVAEKELVKVVKANSKKSKRRVNNSGAKKTPSGFAKPTPLTDALCDFLGVAKGTELARTDVTRRINAYIKEHNLQDPSDKRKIHPDNKLSTVLAPSDEPYSFFSLQRSIKHNFIKV